MLSPLGPKGLNSERKKYGSNLWPAVAFLHFPDCTTYNSVTLVQVRRVHHIQSEYGFLVSSILEKISTEDLAAVVHHIQSDYGYC
jgi:hypothetical protein